MKGMSISGVLLVLFVTLKLTGNIDWSWWWVLAPLWAGWALFVVIAAAVALLSHPR